MMEEEVREREGNYKRRTKERKEHVGNEEKE